MQGVGIYNKDGSIHWNMLLKRGKVKWSHQSPLNDMKDSSTNIISQLTWEP